MKKKHPKHVLDLNGNSFSVRAIGEANEFSCEGVTLKQPASIRRSGAPKRTGSLTRASSWRYCNAALNGFVSMKRRHASSSPRIDGGLTKTSFLGSNGTAMHA